MQVEHSPEYHELYTSEFNRLSILWGISDEIIKRVLRFDYDRLDLQTGDWSNLSFLKDHIGRVKKLFIGSENCDWSIINEFYNLEELVIGGWFKTKLSFSKFTKLKVLDTYWNDGYSDDIYDLPMLEKLSITGGDFVTMEMFASYKNLRKLEVIDSYKLESVDGIEELDKLDEVSFYGIRKLNDIKALGQLKNLEMLVLEGCNKLYQLQGLSDSKSLKRLFIERCTGLRDYSFLKGNISNTLEILTLIDLKIESLDDLSELSDLHLLSLMGSKIVDGDLNILFKLKNLKSVLLKNSRNFHPSAKQVEAFFKAKRG